MKKITFECETITPMFCYGADQKTPEIRAASIKGAMRFWWRALHPDLVKMKDGKPDYSKLREDEKEIFGGTGDGNAKRSSFTVKVKYQKHKMDRDEYSPVPHKNNGKAFPQPCFKEGNRFEIILETKNDAMPELVKLISILGGIGKRSRRGFGSFRILKIDGTPFTYSLTSENIKETAKAVNDQFPYTADGKVDYPYLKDVKIGKTSSSKDALLEKIGKASHDYNSNCTGFIKPKRFSSPLLVSVFKDSLGEPRIILSELNCVPENCDKNFCTKGKRIAFIKEVLR